MYEWEFNIRKARERPEECLIKWILDIENIAINDLIQYKRNLGNTLLKLEEREYCVLIHVLFKKETFNECSCKLLNYSFGKKYEKKKVGVCGSHARNILNSALRHLKHPKFKKLLLGEQYIEKNGKYVPFIINNKPKGG